jgi:hypothetical protein
LSLTLNLTISPSCIFSICWVFLRSGVNGDYLKTSQHEQILRVTLFQQLHI